MAALINGIYVWQHCNRFDILSFFYTKNKDIRYGREQIAALPTIGNKQTTVAMCRKI